MAATSEAASAQQVPLRIAVTGHRDLDPADVPELRATIERLCKALRERLPGIHVELVSGMADGADRVAAEAALAAGLGVHALLPMPLDMYLDDFSPESQAELKSLLADARVTCTELELPEGIDHESASVPGWARDALYVALAERLRRGSSILLAVWDGEDRGLPGGTGDTVLRFLGLVTKETARAPRKLSLQPATEEVAEGERPVFWLRARRRGAPGEANGVAGFLGITDDGDVAVIGRAFPHGLEEELGTLVDYARDAGKHVQPASHPWGLLSDESLALRPKAAAALRAIDWEYRRADLLAIHHQQRSDRLFKAFSLMAATMGLLFLAYAKLYPGKFFLAGYLILFIGGIGLYSFARRRGWFTRHLMYRAIAESLRTRFYLSIAGIPSRGVEQHLMRLLGVRRIAGFSWIGHILRASTPFELGPTEDPARCVDWVRRTWLEDQHRYFERKAHALHHAHHRLEKFKLRVLGSMVVAIVALMTLKETMATVVVGLPVKTYVVFLLGLVPLWLGIWEIYQTKMATKELGWQYQNQRFHLERAVHALSHTGSVKRALVILGETAERLLADTYLWTVQRFHREHEPPAAG
jgi:signal transduction histidine kinase